MRPTNVSLEQRQRMAEMYAKGKSIREISIEMGYTPPCVTYQLRRAGVELRASGKPAERFFTDEEFAEIIEWFRQGASRQNVATRLKMARTTLYIALGRYVIDHISDFVPKNGGNAPDNDPINHPSHYTHGEMECIDAIAAMLGIDGAIAFCRGSAIKYSYRKGYKGTPKDAEQDAKKCMWYLHEIGILKKRKREEDTNVGV